MKPIELIAFDLDGTLLDSEKRLSPRNKEALVQCIQRGIQIVPATGRPLDGIMKEIRTLPGINYAITTNGGSIADLSNDQSLHRCTLSNQKALELFEIIKKYNAMYDPYINGRGVTQPQFIEHMDHYGLPPVIQKMIRATRDTVPNVIQYVKECGQEVEKVNVYLGDLEEREILRKELSSMEGIIISSSFHNNLEINALGATKGNALMWLAEYLHIDPKATMAFGDGENDLTMLKMAGVGIAMGNGLEAAKQAADKITLTNDEDGVAETIERLVFNGN